MNRSRCLLLLAFLSLWATTQANATDLNLSWNAVVTDANGNALPMGSTISYNVYGAAQGQPLKLLANVTATANVRSNVDPGTACYAVSAVLVTLASTSGLEGAQTAQICSTVVSSVPTPPAAPIIPSVPANFQIQQSTTPAS